MSDKIKKMLPQLLTLEEIEKIRDQFNPRLELKEFKDIYNPKYWKRYNKDKEDNEINRRFCYVGPAAELEFLTLDIWTDLKDENILRYEFNLD